MFVSGEPPFAQPDPLTLERCTIPEGGFWHGIKNWGLSLVASVCGASILVSGTSARAQGADAEAEVTAAATSSGEPTADTSAAAAIDRHARWRRGAVRRGRGAPSESSTTTAIIPDDQFLSFRALHTTSAIGPSSSSPSLPISATRTSDSLSRPVLSRTSTVRRGATTPVSTTPISSVARTMPGTHSMSTSISTRATPFMSSKASARSGPIRTFTTIALHALESRARRAASRS